MLNQTKWERILFRAGVIAGVFVILIVLGVAMSHAQVVAPSGTWSVTGSMHAPRAQQATALLQNGKVLVAGGWSLPGNLAASEIFDPATGTWSLTGSMALDHASAPAVTLPNGKVLVAGGCINGCTNVTPVAELYDPATGKWSYTGYLGSPRYYYTATLLKTGKVLVVGGCNAAACGGVTASAELYDPATGTWTPTGSLNVARDYQTATLLASGNVLITGGYGYAGYLDSAEIYNVSTGKWSMAGSMTNGRAMHTATLLPSGKVLITGGNGVYGMVLATAEVFNPVGRSFTAVGSMAYNREDHTATLLPNGKVAIVGGTSIQNRMYVSLAAVELFNPLTRTFITTGSMHTGRTEHSVIKLPTGQVLAIGGIGSSSYLSSAELYQP